MGVEAADLSRRMLRSTEVELCGYLEVSKKSGDSCRSKGLGQGSPHSSGGHCNEISDVQRESELDGTIGHQVQ